MGKKFHQIKRTILEAPLYYLVSGIIALCRHTPRSFLTGLGKGFGFLAFYIISDYRKTALTNLALAFPEKTFDERYKIARQSLQHLIITLLELLAIEQLVGNIDKLITIVTSSRNPKGFSSEEVISNEDLEETFKNLQEKQGLILFCGHQANWELPFLYITKNYPGIAFAKAIKNQRLSKKIFALREVFKGKIVPPKNGIQQGIEALNQGKLVGIVGDQALLMSSYTYPLFGSPAFTTTSPALLAYKTGFPVIAVNVSRQAKGFEVIPSAKLYANKSLPMKESVAILMDQMMGFLEKGIASQPEQWMWIHKRWKRKISNVIKKKYRYSHILVFVDQVSSHFSFLKALAECFSGTTLHLTLGNADHLEELQEQFPEYSLIQLRNDQDILALPNCYPAIFDLTNNLQHLYKHFRKTGSCAVYSKRFLEKSLDHPQAPLKNSLRIFYSKNLKDKERKNFKVKSKGP
ncbi:LpxL/LpxP family acyltransferase [Chlamydia pneumoniae]|uniref:Lipid A biosynthesis lauroyl acyltransferase, putative n=1 Tax=Chlamydia pneumoniae TaxID=83558 RepID=Q9K217_CHLPN|nr:lauroyl acyltransferase [Chlamydia pneumoniae]AAF38487.1 lipid A biosynthesis lauroyl acyltransferase, putative [Chlamydia pneumoniae AR39]CRI35456.1 Lipid A biosynthesis lauroyl acyltransferase, putative [Chlamydia pneumoniae]CRI41103.1 Lipid A biosynthesis lauroyl acyltransferase, putative [Chlamydia pneumoniae]CRI72738.1 Lipid A biosynthesis lauroyl acyltransferase, putative [Chlamydia pneumoniae]